MKRFIITSGWAYMTENGGTSSALSDAKIFDNELDAEITLYDSDLDIYYWEVKEV